MRRLLLLAWFITAALPPPSSTAQALNATDTAEIRQKARRHVQQFERLLNLIAQPEEYFRKYGFEKLIRSYYRAGSNRQIFRDSLVVIEDDLNPNARGVRYNNLLTVKDYLNAFFSLYGKSVRPGVSFRNYEVSPVKQDDFTYVEVFYDSEFRNRHRAFPDTPYPLRPRKATVRAERQGPGWRVTIVDISHHRPGTPPVAETADRLASEVPGQKDTIRQAREANVLPKPPEANLSPVEKPTTEVAETNGNPFADLRRAYRRGQTYALPTEAVGSASLVLYRRGEPVEDLSYILADSSAAWTVSSELSSGNDYQLRLIHPESETGEAVMSPTFAVKRRIPWAIVAGAAGAVVVLVAIITGRDDSGGSEGDNTLPAPPAPE